MKKPRLNRIQLETLEQFRSYRETYGYSPTIREFGMWLGMSKSGAHRRLEELRDLGYLMHDPALARSWVEMK